MSDSAGSRLAELVRQGRKIDAIKLLREETGCGLAEAKAAVERLERGEADPPAGSSGDLQLEIQRLLRAGRKIEAVKVYRERTQLGLKEAKDAVDAIEAGL